MAINNLINSLTGPVTNNFTIVETLPLQKDCTEYENLESQVMDALETIMAKFIIIDTKWGGDINGIRMDNTRSFNPEDIRWDEKGNLMGGAVKYGNPLVFLNYSTSGFNLEEFLNVISKYEAIKQEHYKSKVIITLNNNNSDVISSSIKQTLTLFNKEEVFDDIKFINNPNNATFLEYLHSEIDMISHGTNSQRANEFTQYLNLKYMEGNLQTSIDEKFIIFNDSIGDRIGKFDIFSQNTDISQIDFNKYAAIFIDNNWKKEKHTQNKIGDGIHLLKDIKRTLNDSNIKNIPIFYQTAHDSLSLEEMTIIEPEIESFLSQGMTVFDCVVGGEDGTEVWDSNVYIISKNSAPKINKDLNMAINEMIIPYIIQDKIHYTKDSFGDFSTLSKNNLLDLKKYTTKLSTPIECSDSGITTYGMMFTIGEDNKNSKHITITNAINPNERNNALGITRYESNILKKLEINSMFNNKDIPSKINHKMYVLALFHTVLKEHTRDHITEKLKVEEGLSPEYSDITKHELNKPKDFFEFEEIQGKIANNCPNLSEVVNKLKNTYQRIIEKHKELKPTVIAHNDTKWDNWFCGTILGDFGSSSPGREYKDLARAFMGQHQLPDKTTLIELPDKESIDDAINNYITIRKEIDGKKKIRTMNEMNDGTFILGGKNHVEEYLIDQGFKENPEEFKINVYEMILTESLRIAAHKSHSNSKLMEGTKLENPGEIGRDIINSLVKIADNYSGILKEYSKYSKEIKTKKTA